MSKTLLFAIAVSGSLFLAGAAVADDDRKDRERGDGAAECGADKIEAAGKYFRCLSREAAEVVEEGSFEDRRCTRKLARKFRRAERDGECTVEDDAGPIGDFLAEVQLVVDDAILIGADLPDVIEPICEPENVDLFDFEYYANDAGYWCGDATLLNRGGTPVQSEIFPYPYANYKVFWVNDIQGARIETRTLALYPPLSAERCDELAAAGITNALGSGVCGENGAGKIYVSEQEAADCSGTVKGVFPIGSTPLFSEGNLVSDRIQVYRQEFVEGGALLLDGITTIQNDALVTNGQIWDPREAPGLDQLYASYFDRMRKCTRAEFLAEIAIWSNTYNVPQGETCGIDSANMPSGTTCIDFFDVNFPVVPSPPLVGNIAWTP